MSRTPFRRLAVATGAVAALALLAVAAPASAHITVNADDNHQGAADCLLTFRVPDEEAAATTVKVAISFPKATPLPSVKPAPKPGWTFTTTKVTFNPPIKTDDGTITDGVSQVVYTASTPGAAIPVGGFDTFQVLVGPLPASATALSFPTVQTYSNGKAVSWIQPVTDPANEPDSPAPTLTLLPAAHGDAGTATAAAAGSTSQGSASQGSASQGSASATDYARAGDLSTARTLAVAALVVAVLGLVAALGGAVLAARRR